MTHFTTPRPGSTRTFKAEVLFNDCGTIREVKTFTIHLTKTTDSYTALIGGLAVELDDARDLLMLARSQGTLTETERSELEAAVIGKAVASRLHKDLFRLGYTRNGAHYQLATEVLGRPVASLAGLSAADAAQVWSYACAQMGRATLPSVVYGLVA